MHHLALALPLLLALVAAPAAAQVELSLAGHILPADGGRPDGLRVRVLHGADTASAISDSLGGFALALPRPTAGEWVTVRVDEPGAGEPRYHAVSARLPVDSALARVDVVLVPLRWRIGAGAFAGDTVEIRLRHAFEPWCAGCSRFYRVAEGADQRGWPIPVPSWPDSLFPLRVAFEPDGAPRGVTASDSLAFWAVIDGMERELGVDVFRAVPLAETEPTEEEAFPEDLVLVVLDPTIETAGYGGTGQQRGDILHATVRFRSGRTFASGDAPHLIRHEMMHALGFGHTCSFPSVLAGPPSCPGLRTERLSREEVAYAQLLIRATRLQRTHPHALGVESAVR